MADNSSQQEQTDGDSSIETPLNCKQLISLNYPGVVKNPPKMLETLGGANKVSQAFNDGHAPLALNFQPGNPYCKPTRGIATRSTSLLMKVKHRYRRRTEPEDGGGQPQAALSVNEEYSAEVLGVIGQKYEFPYLCDFQFLPYEHKPYEEPQSLIEKIVPSAGEDMSYVDKDVPSFMLPEIFSKFDKPIPFNYKAGTQLPVRDSSRQERETDFRAKLIQHGRHKRTNYAHVVSTMGDFKIPTEPHPIAVEHLEAQKPGAAKDELIKLFEERPLWSRNALRCNTEMSTLLIKTILCVVAYYFQQGPWRGLWCRMGYDPREHPEAKKYQLLDFRIRKELTDKRLKLLLKKKKTMILYPHQSLKAKRGIPTPLLGSNPGQKVDHKETVDSYYIMRRGILPAYHQMFYQLCDLDDPELQAIINNPCWHKKKPNMKTGYFEVDMFRELRDALTRMIKDTVLEVNAAKSGQDNTSQDSMPSTSVSTSEAREEGWIGEGEDDEGDEEGEYEEGERIEDVDEQMEGQGMLDAGHREMNDNDEEEEEEDEMGMEKGDRDQGEDSESENEMAMEMLEFMDSSVMPS